MTIILVCRFKTFNCDDHTCLPIQDLWLWRSYFLPSENFFMTIILFLPCSKLFCFVDHNTFCFVMITFVSYMLFCNNHYSFCIVMLTFFSLFRDNHILTLSQNLYGQYFSSQLVKFCLSWATPTFLIIGCLPWVSPSPPLSPQSPPKYPCEIHFNFTGMVMMALKVMMMLYWWW